MNRSQTRKRPWLAALLSAFVVGLGHLYLRRWRRALGWLVALVATSGLFVDPTTLKALASGNPFDPLAIAPIFLVSSLCVLDAYAVARAQNLIRRVSPAADGRLTHCPNCGKELDPDLSFCQWCSTEIDRSETLDGDTAIDRR
mgnify:CR=1 FL=1